MPGPAVHYHLTLRLAAEAGFSVGEAAAIGQANMLVDENTPGNRYWWLHFNPTASLYFAPFELRRARAAERAGDHTAALAHLGTSIHMRQDAVGHGRIGQNHLLWELGWLKRHPDEWETMPAGVQARIERATRRALSNSGVRPSQDPRPGSDTPSL